RASIRDRPEPDHFGASAPGLASPSLASALAIFKPRKTCHALLARRGRGAHVVKPREQPLMQSEPRGEDFNIDEARRVLGDVFAPWVRDLGLSLESIHHLRPPDAAGVW